MKVRDLYIMSANSTGDNRDKVLSLVSEYSPFSDIIDYEVEQRIRDAFYYDFSISGLENTFIRIHPYGGCDVCGHEHDEWSTIIELCTHDSITFAYVGMDKEDQPCINVELLRWTDPKLKNKPQMHDGSKIFLTPCVRCTECEKFIHKKYTEEYEQKRCNIHRELT